MNLGEKIGNFLSKKFQPSQITKISSPSNVVNEFHVSYDSETKTFYGLPAEWEEQVKNLFA